MTDLLMKLGPKQRKGSKPRCHWLTHGSAEQVAVRLTRLIGPWGYVSARDHWMPEGFENTEEAELHKAPRLLDEKIGRQLRDWWLAVISSRPKTPNFDIASTCIVTGNGGSRPGLLLVEAKAHSKELNDAETGKRLATRATANSRSNHDRIGECIKGAALDLTKETGMDWSLSRDRNYQMANRFAWSWKLTELGFPVILVYLGFLNAKEMRRDKTQKPYANHAEWETHVKAHSRPLFPETVWDKSWTLHGQSFILLI